jgi:hypothetical protein
MGDLAGRLRTRLTGNPDAFVFRVETKPRWGRERSICRDDRDIHQHFLRPVAEKLGLNWKGFGFHAFRREGVTATAARLGIAQAMRMAGHSKADMTLLYTLEDHEAQQAAVEERQKRMRAKWPGRDSCAFWTVTTSGRTSTCRPKHHKRFVLMVGPPRLELETSTVSR